jgi:hypothetical protein
MSTTLPPSHESAKTAWEMRDEDGLKMNLCSARLERDLHIWYRTRPVMYCSGRSTFFMVERVRPGGLFIPERETRGE